MRKTKQELDADFATALDARLHAEYARGKEEGIAVAKTIRNWLTRQPDTKWQKQVREWADRAIEAAERDLRND